MFHVGQLVRIKENASLESLFSCDEINLSLRGKQATIISCLLVAGHIYYVHAVIDDDEHYGWWVREDALEPVESDEI